MTLYDPQTRAPFASSQPKPSVGSQTKGIKTNSDGSYGIFFGPKAPEGFENNWLETIIDLKSPTVDHILQYLFSRNKFPPAYFRTLSLWC
jgi:hypothetical protein